MTIKQDIYRVMEQNDGLTAREIAACIGRKYSTWLRNHIEEMVSIGDLKRIKRRSPNGRPAFVYKMALKAQSLRKEYQAERLRGYPFSYEMWLEDQIRNLRGNGG